MRRPDDGIWIWNCGAMEAWQALPYPTMQATLQDLESTAVMVIYLVIGYYQQIMLSIVWYA